MRITQLQTLCITTVPAILFSGLPASTPFGMKRTPSRANTSYPVRSSGRSSVAAHLKRINIFSADGKDPRIALDRTAESARAFAPIAMIERNNAVPLQTGQSAITQATAFMVSPCFALTNRHAVFGFDKTPNPPGDHSVAFNIGPDTSGEFRYALKGTAVRWGNGSSDGQDFALLQLNKCAGKKTGWMELKVWEWNKVENLQVAMAGCPADRIKAQLSFQRSCTIKKLKGQSEAYLHDCAARPGASGSPIFVMENGLPKVIGFHAGADTDLPGVLTSYTEQNANSAVPLDFLEAYPEVKKLIQEDIDRFGQPNPAMAPVFAPLKGSSTAGKTI